MPCNIVDLEAFKSLRMAEQSGPLCVHGAALSKDGTAVVMDVPEGTELTGDAAITLGHTLVHLGELAKQEARDRG